MASALKMFLFSQQHDHDSLVNADKTSSICPVTAMPTATTTTSIFGMAFCLMTLASMFRSVIFHTNTALTVPTTTRLFCGVCVRTTTITNTM